MARKSIRCIRFDDYVCRRIVGGRIHRVGTVKGTRGRKTNIVNGEVSDFDWHRSVSITSGLALLTRCTAVPPFRSSLSGRRRLLLAFPALRTGQLSSRPSLLRPAAASLWRGL